MFIENVMYINSDKHISFKEFLGLTSGNEGSDEKLIYIDLKVPSSCIRKKDNPLKLKIIGKA
jgi:hypothetical protein